MGQTLLEREAVLDWEAGLGGWARGVARAYRVIVSAAVSLGSGRWRT